MICLVIILHKTKKNSPQNNSEASAQTEKNLLEILNERYISS